MTWKDICFKGLLSGIIWLSLHLSCLAQIQLPVLFTDSMVVQRGQAVPVWGSGACKGCQVTVELNGSKAATAADQRGNWKLSLPAMSAGGPYLLKISDKHGKRILKDVYVGEVWLASGQSNMQFTLAQSEQGQDDIKQSGRPMLRLFNMVPRKEALPTSKNVYEPALLSELEKGAFYQPGQWVASRPETAKNFSAVAYHFGKYLQDSLGVAVGLICNAVGGTSTQSYISDTVLRNHPRLAQFTSRNGADWTAATDIHPWLVERALANLKHYRPSASRPVYPHPFAPAYLYETGIKPLIPFAIKGAIWYQGESNATHPDIHDELFTALVSSWRGAWQQGNFPFYYVQLPGISNRTRWPEMRESQRRLSISLPNAGMAVTIDLGDSLDVHPKNKKEVGKRLALMALAQTYKKQLPLFCGPVFRAYQLNGREMRLQFDQASGLRPRIGTRVLGFALSGYSRGGQKLTHHDIPEAAVEGNEVVLTLPSGIQPITVWYGWSPWPVCNLVNASGLPAGPFKIELPGNN